jgi:hypothetical protein
MERKNNGRHEPNQGTLYIYIYGNVATKPSVQLLHCNEKVKKTQNTLEHMKTQNHCLSGYIF